MDSCPMDGRISELETDVRRLVKVVEGNGQPGLVTTITDFIAEQRGREHEREKQIKRNNTAWNLRILALTAAIAAAELFMHGCAKHISFSENPINITGQEAAQSAHLPNLR